jgi:hypothetical protein
LSAQTTGIPSGNTRSNPAITRAKSGLCRASAKILVLEGQTIVARGSRANSFSRSNAES